MLTLRRSKFCRSSEVIKFQIFYNGGFYAANLPRTSFNIKKKCATNTSHSMGQHPLHQSPIPPYQCHCHQYLRHQPGFSIQGDYRGILARMYKKCTEYFRMYKNVHSLKCTKKCTKILVKST